MSQQENVALVERWLAAFNDGSWRDRLGEFFGQDFVFTAAGHQTGDFAGMPATGRPIALPATAIYRFVGGKIVEDWEVMDRVVILQQIGMIPA